MIRSSGSRPTRSTSRSRTRTTHIGRSWTIRPRTHCCSICARDNFVTIGDCRNAEGWCTLATRPEYRQQTHHGWRTDQPMDALSKQHEREHLVAELFGADPATEVLAGRLLRTREVALLFQVSERAVTDCARKGRLPSARTP